jgi:hypothetical protein
MPPAKLTVERDANVKAIRIDEAHLMISLPVYKHFRRGWPDADPNVLNVL